MKKIFFVVLLMFVLIISGCVNNTQEPSLISEKGTETITEKSTTKKEITTKNDKTENATQPVSDKEIPTETVTEKKKMLPLAENNQTSYIHLRNTGVIGDELFYSNDHEWEYCENSITTILSEDISQYIGKFFIVDGYIYYTPAFSGDGNYSVELWRMKVDGTRAEFITDDLSYGFNCVYVDGYILYNCYSEYNNYFGLMSLNLETMEKINYASINNIQYTYNGIAYYLDGNYIKYFNPKTEETGIVRNTGGSFICGDGHYIYYISSGSGNGLFRIDLNNYSANEFVRSGVSITCVVINDVVYYYPYNALTTSEILVYDIKTGSDLDVINIGLTRKIYRFWNENGYLMFNVQNGNDELNMSDYIINVEKNKIYKTSNYSASVS